MAEFLAMGGYAGFVWTALGLAVVVMAGLVLLSLRDLRAAEVAVAALEQAADGPSGSNAESGGGKRP